MPSMKLLCFKDAPSRECSFLKVALPAHGFRTPQKLKDDITVLERASKSTCTFTSPLEPINIPLNVYSGKKRLFQATTTLCEPNADTSDIDGPSHGYLVEDKFSNVASDRATKIKKKELNPELYMLAQVLLSVPATQVRVERLFSGFKFLWPPSSSNIKEKILEEQLFVRTNLLFNRKEQTPFSITNNENFEIGILDKSNSNDGEEYENTNKEEQSLNGNKTERRAINEVVDCCENGKNRKALKSENSVKRYF